MSELIDQASNSVIVLHQIIADVFNGDGSKIPQLLGHFSPEFTMVTPTGKMLSLDEVGALFAQLTGGRKGVAITIERCQLIARFGQRAVIQYHERQQQGNRCTDRIALAVIDCACNPPRWHYLQETMVVS
ncbi:hypothetical protein [Erwinia tasmaniensis]|uniref:DUF4440 domain-containing protein n=1 Tax=Erwinia tasmaniensis (strain DSM 17950 / CFBP 7177 / CIP 109463 / NCPPB 4357 / Et1/99) TaxID=465817 RepID=B2VBN2_ERWT9|nr:hypothetical protein [Erwinia tasmaniensis]CAO97374.1 Conserved hypothetical protein [Erwinia tasmaniensis Et1/99]